MQAIQKFSSGYIKTLLFAVEYMSRFQFPQKLFIIPHFIHHIQIVGLMLEKSENILFNYLITLTQFSIVEVVLPETLKIIYLIALFIFQLLLLAYLLVATVEAQRVADNAKLRFALEKKIDFVNSLLHWYFTFYNAFSIPIAAISFYFISSEYAVFQVFSIIILCLQFFQGMILIYLLRNHRFAENNSFKRRFAIAQMINYSLSYVIVFLRYGYQSRVLQLLIGILYCVIQIIDQFYSCPYRDPFREPSLKAALILLSTITILFICEFNSNDGSTQLYWILFAAGLMSGLADSASGLFHEFAMTNYNSLHNLQEKYIIIGVDQFYFHFMHFLEDDKTKLLYYQQLIKHRENCQRSKCPSQTQNLLKVNPNDKIQLHKMTLQIVSCIFKTCHSRTVIKNGVIFKPKFEQLQLQYISFLSIIAQRPMIGFVELRRYQLNQTQDNSLYFRELTSKIGSELQFQILYLQNRMIKQQLKKDRFFQDDEKLSIAQIWKSINFYQQITPTIIDLIERKQKYWEALINGFDDLGQVQDQQEILCLKIDQIYKQVKTQIMIPEILFDRSKDVAVQTILKSLNPEDRNINILNLKIYSLLYSVILNDYDRAFQAEKQIEELIREDRQKSIDIIDDSALQKDNAVIILVSLVKKKGHIVNLNLLTLANFFEFDNADDISSSSLISSFLPPDLRHHHDQKLNNFISKGFTRFSVQSIHSYYIQKFGYLRECYVKLSNLFQDSEDFVITASVLKLFPSCDIIMFDSFGKVIGVSEEFFEKRIKSQMTISRFIEQGHIFLLLPFIMVNLRKMALANELDSLEFIDYAYFYQDLTDLCLQYSTLYANQMRADYYKQQSTYQLSTIKSQLITCNSGYSNQNSQEYLKMNGIPIALLGVERMISIAEFLIRYVREKGDRNTESIKVKYTIKFSDIESKNDIYPYFTLRMEQLNEFECDSIHVQTYSKAIKRTISALRTGDTQMSATESMSGAFKTQQMTHDSVDNQLQQINESILQINIKQTNDDSYIPVIGSKLDKVIFENPVISEQGADDLEFQELFQQLQFEEEKLKQDLKDPEYESDQIEKKSSSTKGRMKVKKNILEIFTQNKMDQVEIQVDQKAPSRASTSKTTSSKSPYLLIRSLYQVRERDLSIWGIILLNVMIILITLGLIFVKVFILQDQYNILQQNLIFVQYPETINNYFLRTTMYSQIFLQQQLGIANYSSQINEAILKDFNLIAVSIESDLKSIYEDIITFESQVIPSDDYLNIINNLKEYKYKFDLTIILEQLSSTAISLNAEYTDNILTLNSETLSQILFLRFNMVLMIKIARSYISYLNENLIYYEEQIINVLTYIVVIELSILTIFIMFQIKILQDLNLYMKKILILTTKLSEDEASQINSNLQEIKIILKDARQVLWKNSNFVNILYSDKNEKKVAKMIPINSMYNTQNRVNKDGKLEVKRKYQTTTLTSRIYSLRLPQRTNYIFLLFLWLIIASYLLGALGLAISMISQIKPSLALNLQLIEFKLKYDALVVFAETTLTDRIEQMLIRQQFQVSSLDFKNDEIIVEFNVLVDGFQQQMGIIYDQLALSSSLLEAQKNDLLIPFTNNLCETLGDIMPSCTDSTMDPTDNNYIFISGGIVNAVHEFSKTLQTYWDSELNNEQNNLNQDELSEFLNSQTHNTQLTEHFIYQGKVLEIIAQKMLLYNRLTLDSVIQQFQIYIYVTGLSLILIFGILLTLWVKRVEETVYLSKMALTFIPSNALSEQKTLQELKNIQNY